MAVSVEVLRSWLETLDSDSDVWVDEDGLTLQNKGEKYEAYIEIGGVRDELSCFENK
jgi:hypothetical protein